MHSHIRMERKPSLQDWSPRRVGQLERVIGSFRFPALLVDASHRVLLVNACFETSFGHRAAEIAGQPVTEFVLLPELTFEEALFPWQSAKQNLTVRTASGAGLVQSVFTMAVGAPQPPGGTRWPMWLAVFASLEMAQRRDAALMTHGWAELLNVVTLQPVSAALPADEIAASPRERQIDMLEQLGCDTKRIAHVLNITASTVRVLRSRGRRKQMHPARGALALAS